MLIAVTAQLCIQDSWLTADVIMGLVVGTKTSRLIYSTHQNPANQKSDVPLEVPDICLCPRDKIWTYCCDMLVARATIGYTVKGLM